jgi:hypothetical protein
MVDVDITTERPGAGGGHPAGSSFSDLLFNAYNADDPTKLTFFDCSQLPTGAHAYITLGAAGQNSFSSLVTVVDSDSGAAVTIIPTALSVSYPDAGTAGYAEFKQSDTAKYGRLLPVAAGIVDNRFWHLPDRSGEVALSGDGTDPPAAGTMGKVNRGGQSADIASVKLTDTMPIGFYLIVGSLECTTAAGGAGTVTITFSWTDGSGAKTSAITQNLAVAGSMPIAIPAHLTSGDITWAVTHTGLYLTAIYAFNIKVLALG